MNFWAPNTKIITEIVLMAEVLLPILVYLRQNAYPPPKLVKISIIGLRFLPDSGSQKPLYNL